MTPKQPLTGEELGDDPIVAFARWLDEAEDRSHVAYANAVCLSTVDEHDWPEGRMVLLKGVEDRGFVFFTNYHSAKGRALEAMPRAALTFYWDDLGRQVRVQGAVEPVSAEDSDTYFRTRPRGSQLGAWVSEQSAPVEGREELETRWKETAESYEGRDIPRPPHWGGYLIRPKMIEFWQEGAHRLHDRIRFQRAHGSGWRVDRISP